MNTLEDRLRLALKEAQERMPTEKINQAWLSRAVGISTAGITKWFNGSTQSLEGENLLKASRALGVNPEWLASGTGPMKSGASESKSEVTYLDAQPEPKPPSVDDLLNLLSQRLNETDESTKSSVGQMLLKYSENPDPNSRIANAIKALLDDKDK